jgi:hypothetical protein
MTIAALQNGVMVLAEECTGTSSAGDCSRNSGIASLYDLSGRELASTDLWRDQEVEAGGSAPTFVGRAGDSLWVAGPSKLYEIDEAGALKNSIPRFEGTTPCLEGETPFGVAVDPGGLTIDSQGHKTVTLRSDSSAGPSSKVSLVRWSGEEWVDVPNGETLVASIAPNVSCTPGGVAAWNNNQVVATWTSAAGWNQRSGTALTHPSSTATDGGAYVLVANGEVERIDPTTGETVSTALLLGAASAGDGTPSSLSVDESGTKLFACAGKLTGLPGAADSPGTECGFAPVPS